MPKLAAIESCTGCTACASACPKTCITMSADENGFLFPMVEETRCVACGLCERVCPVLTPVKPPESEPQAFAAYSMDETVRMESSSGGLFSELAKAVLAEGGVVYGAAYNDKFEVVHICAETDADLEKLRGAKYAQSDLRGVFPQIRQRLDRGEKVLFSGTPCQVAGLKGFLKTQYENLLTVDFVCHSVPSPMAWQAYVQYRAQQDHEGQSPCKINLRSKQTGWSNYQYSNVFTYEGGKTHRVKSGDSLYMKLFVGGYINREACGDCRFKGYRRCSDLTLGDFWGIWEIAPEMDDDKGTSVVLVQSECGADLLQKVSRRIVLKPVTTEEASRQNSAMLQASCPHEKRNEVLTQIRAGEIAFCEAWFDVHKPTVIQRVRQRIDGWFRRRSGL